MQWSLEVIPVCVDDVDDAKRFYEDQVGFHLDLDIEIGATGRVVQLTPRGSASSIHLKRGATRVDGLQIVVDDVDAARAELIARGVDVSAVQRVEDGEFREGRGGDWNSFVFFTDPAGNAWVIQERPSAR
ncbi:VOC family protein [Planococcus sp. APC 4015]|nr:VOC family protein [Planococcus sp. APC 4015]